MLNTIKNTINNQNLLSHLIVLNDPRIDRKKKHHLIDILVIAICASICGAETWVEIADYGKQKEEWFKEILNLKNGIPSHDTFRRVFMLINPEEFTKAFYSWVFEINNSHMVKDHICIDGKSLRGSSDNCKQTTAIHMVNAWSTGASLSLGQLESEGKNNEIKTIPKLLDILNLEGTIVSTDAMGCQIKIADKIIEKGGDFCFGLKGNQPTIETEVKNIFSKLEIADDEAFRSNIFTQENKGHGRLEKRECKVVTANNGIMFDEEIFKNWPDLNSLIEIKSTRMDLKTWIITEEKRYYISSLKACNAKKISNVIRNHWGIENNLHWQLDISFREDECRSRSGFSPQNFSQLRHISLNLLKAEATKISINRKRKMAGWNDEYLLKILLNDGKVS